MLEPDEGREPLRMLEPGTLLRVVKEAGDWVQVSYADPQWRDRIGYVQVRHLLGLSTTSADQTAARPAVPLATGPLPTASVPTASLGPGPLNVSEPVLSPAPPTPAVHPPPTLELFDWVGERFVVLPSSPASRATLDFIPPISPKNWAGKRLTASKVDLEGRPDAGTAYVEFITETGETLRAPAVDGSVRGIAPVRDIDYARTWLNRSLWLIEPSVHAYDPAAPASVPVESRSLGRTAHVVVKDVVLGTDASRPVRLIVQGDDGWLGAADVRITGTNVSRTERDDTSGIANRFYTSDPHAAHADWSPRVWTAIAGSQVFVGMTAAQARMSRGEPHRVSEAIVGGLRGEKWIYSDGTSFSLVDDVVSEVPQ
jgi:hypothetical protein